MLVSFIFSDAGKAEVKQQVLSKFYQDRCKRVDNALCFVLPSYNYLHLIASDLQDFDPDFLGSQGYESIVMNGLPPSSQIGIFICYLLTHKLTVQVTVGYDESMKEKRNRSYMLFDLLQSDL